MEFNSMLSLVLLPIALIIIAVALFRKPGKQTMKVELVEKKRLTHDTILFTFALPDSSKKLGLKIG